jgi:hypothetical protein
LHLVAIIEIVTNQQQQCTNNQSYKPAGEKQKHKQHPYCNPKGYKTNHFFHATSPLMLLTLSYALSYQMMNKFSDL